MYRELIYGYRPLCEQEEADRLLMQRAAETYGDELLERSCTLAHLTASSMIFNRERDKVLMVYHNIYDSWAWTGGHADGEADLRSVAVREAMEETGAVHFSFLTEDAVSLDALPVPGHWKRGSFVSPHLHLNFTWLLEADEGEPLRIKADESSGVKWIPVNKLEEYVTEKDMLPVYRKLIERAARPA